MKRNFTIAMCDILGFSNLVKSNPLDKVVENALGWFSKALYFSINKSEAPKEIPRLADLRNQSQLGIAWFSDTVLIYTLEDSDSCLKTLYSSLGWLFFHTVILSGLTRVRCGVAYGEAFLSDEYSIFVGEPIVDASRLEKAQQWAGGALTPSACNRIPKDANLDEWWLIQYGVPGKNGAPPMNTLAINWTLGIHDFGYDCPWSVKSAEPTEAEWKNKDIAPICEKWKNTRQFHFDVCRDCRRSLEKKRKKG